MCKMIRRWGVFASAVVVLACWLGAMRTAQGEEAPTLRAGGAAIDITPLKFPVIVNGMFEERIAHGVHDRLMARALVLDDGRTRLAIVVVDNLMLPRDLLDDAKALAAQGSGIPTERMLISATHTHSAPAAMGCLGSGLDAEYTRWLPAQIAKSIVVACERLVPARIGWGVVRDDQHNHCRRWIFRPDRMASDPFGQRNVRAHMHPGHQSAQHIGPSGPADVDLSLLAVETRDGKPLAVLANYAMHYYGSPLVSGDFCGRFGDALAGRIGADGKGSPFVGIMSQGTSGDSMWPDYSRPAGPRDLDKYTAAVADVAAKAYRAIEFRDDLTLAMAETTLRLGRRIPDAERLAWARRVMAEVGDRPPRGLAEIYAREQLLLHAEPEADLKLQALRIGELGITAIPNEVYGITGLKLKARSPLQPTFNIELANGAEGYIPPPEQHALGGYTTWPARTAGLEVEAEPKIVAALERLLEEVAGRPSRALVDPEHDYSRQVRAARPLSYWRLGEMAGTAAADAVGKRPGRYEPGVAFFLPGFPGEEPNRAAHFAGGRMTVEVDELGDTYSIACWLWNGLPHDARAVTGYCFSRGSDGDARGAGDHLGIGGAHREAWTGKLILFNGNERDELLAGRTPIPVGRWQHVVFVREGKRVRVHLNGARGAEIEGEMTATFADGAARLYWGGRSDGMFNFEGKLDECALFDRALTPDDIAALYAAAKIPAEVDAEE